MEGGGFHDKAGRAEAALQRIVRQEGLLDWMQFVAANAFDCCQRFAASRLCRQEAAHHRRAVEQHGAGTADAGAADELGAREANLVADHVDEQPVRIVGKWLRSAIDGHGAQFRTPVLHGDFFATGAIAPAISMRSIVSSCFRNASTGCMEGKADLVPWIAISTQRASSSTVTPLANSSFRMRQMRAIVAATSAPKRAE